jgi:hypothetical protein
MTTAPVRGKPMKRIAAFVMAGVLMLASACGPRVNDPADVQAITQLRERRV